MSRLTAVFITLLSFGTIFDPGNAAPDAAATPVICQQDMHNRLRARDLLNKGVSAYEDADLDEAIECFKQAKELDPTLVNAHLYLATAHATKYIPGSSEENTRMLENSVVEFNQVLILDPNNLSAIDGLGAILFKLGSTPFDIRRLEDAKSYHELHMKLSPRDPEPYYWIGVIDWSIAHRKNKELRATYNAKATEPISESQPLTPALTSVFIRECGANVDEGIGYLNQAIQLRPEYLDAMAYLNFLYRQKADMESIEVERDQDIKIAADLIDQIKRIKDKKMGNLPPRLP